MKVPERLLLGAFPCSRVNRTSCARGKKQADACCPPAKCFPLTPNSPFFYPHFSSFLYSLALPSQGPFGASDISLLRTAQAAKQFSTAAVNSVKSTTPAEGRTACPCYKRVTGARKERCIDELFLSFFCLFVKKYKIKMYSMYFCSFSLNLKSQNKNNNKKGKWSDCNTECLK